jgi:hypothetical protein
LVSGNNYGEWENAVKRIGYGLTAMSVVSALSIFHDRFSISNSNWACWYSNCGERARRKRSEFASLYTHNK